MKEIKDYSLLPHNTFGMDVKASLFVEYESVTELQSILSDKNLMAGNWLHIGGGSNLLFKGDYAGTVLHSAIIFQGSKCISIFRLRYQKNATDMKI